MSDTPARILLVDDDPSLRRVLEFQLTEGGYSVAACNDGNEALELYSAQEFDCLITDWRMPNVSGSQLIRRASAINAEVPIIVITAFGDLDTVIEAMQGGAFDFVAKPFDRKAILLTVQKALKYGSALAENRRLRRQVHDKAVSETLIGDSEAMRKVLEVMERVAKTDVTILIQGESGTGKELVAKGIHFSGPRKNRPFIAVNCAALPETLIEAELFGYRKGAFTGAVVQSKGKFEEADGGTIFLDEISAMPVQAQGRLLRVLQEHEVTRLGESHARKLDVRVIASTNEDLFSLMGQGAFREDLYYRLAVVPINLPPLRERREDIPVLTEFFLAKSSEKHHRKMPTLGREVYKRFFDYGWMGNVRELENLVERLVVLSNGDKIGVDDLPFHMRGHPSGRDGLWFELPADPINLEHVEREIIRESLRRHDGNQSHTAKYLGITRSALIYRMQKYGLE